jgi:hypothetical protein
MKKLFLSLLILIVSIQLFAQATATTVAYNRTTKPALMLLLPYATDVAEGAILQKMKELGYSPEASSPIFGKKNTINGYYVFKNVSLKETGDQLMDLYFKVEPKGKKEMNQSLVYMLVGKGADFISVESDSKSYTAGQNFLNKIPAQSASYKLQLDIQAQGDAVKAAEKKLAKLQSDEADMNKKIADLQDQLKALKLQEENQVKVVTAEKNRLDELSKKKP